MALSSDKQLHYQAAALAQQRKVREELQKQLRERNELILHLRQHFIIRFLFRISPVLQNSSFPAPARWFFQKLLFFVGKRTVLRILNQ